MSQEIQDAIRNEVAGAARALWFRSPTDASKRLLASRTPLEIVVVQFQALMSDRGEPLKHVSRMDWSRLVNGRRRCAYAAWELIERRGVTEEWLRFHYAKTITDIATLVIEADANNDKFREVFEGVKAERTYTLDDMRSAYRKGWYASGEGYNGD